MMELALYFPNMKRLGDMDNALRFIDVTKIPHLFNFAFMQNDTNYSDYIVNLKSINWMQEFMKNGLEFSRLYFGQEFCENLIPPPNEVEQSYYYSRQLGWDYTYVTGGSQTDKALEKVRRNLAKLREIGAEVDVVFNDWGVLRILMSEYPEFGRVMGRVLNKQTRLNLFTIPGHGLPVLGDELQEPVDEIREKQVRAYADTSLNNKEFNEALLDWGVKDVDMDIMAQGILRPDDGWQMNLGLYFPWSFIATGRNCATCGTIMPYRSYQITDAPCPRPCQKYNCTPEFRDYKMSVMQRGPAVFTSTMDYASPYFNGEFQYERLIYEPYIPL